MIYNVKSKSSGEVSMLQPNGQQVLTLIGKRSCEEPSVQGIVLPEQMHQALTALESAIANEETARPDACLLYTARCV